jgi:hypothetical protein
VTDQDGRYALVADAFDQFQDVFGFPDAERGGRFVHDHQHFSEHRGTRDGDRLPLPTGKTLHRLGDVLNGGDAERVELFLCLGSHGVAVEDVQPPEQARRRISRPRNRFVAMSSAGATARV